VDAELNRHPRASSHLSINTGASISFVPLVPFHFLITTDALSAVRYNY
jgi:hypothetical protein